jgi:hypothetical protein
MCVDGCLAFTPLTWFNGSIKITDLLDLRIAWLGLQPDDDDILSWVGHLEGDVDYVKFLASKGVTVSMDAASDVNDDDDGDADDDDRDDDSDSEEEDARVSTPVQGHSREMSTPSHGRSQAVMDSHGRSSGAVMVT